MPLKMVTEEERQFAEEQKAKIRGKVPSRVELLVFRGYLYNHFQKPLELLSDKELLSTAGFGPISLAAFRSVIPHPVD